MPGYTAVVLVLNVTKSFIEMIEVFRANTDLSNAFQYSAGNKELT